jgi:aminoglycoside phosphotransferase (APT) family kinase protein
MSSPAEGLRTPPAQHAFDTVRLTAWMQEHIGGFTGPIELRQFAGGQSNPTFLVGSADHR